MIEMLSDEKTYKELKADPAKKSETKMKTLLRAKKDKFRGHVYKKLNTTDGLIPKLYGLPKIHKEGVSLRPIVSFVVSPTYELSKYLSDILSPLVGNSHCCIRNTQDWVDLAKTRRLHRRSLRLPTRRKWAQSGYLCTTPSAAQADAGISWS